LAGNRWLAEVIDHDPQVGDALRDQRNMFQMTGQYPHVVERQAAGCQDPQPLQNVRADDPIRVRLDINQMADADQSRLARTYIECSFNAARMRERRPTNHACDPIIGVSIGEQCLIFRRVIRRFNRHGAVDPSRLELRRQVVWLKGTPKRLERGIACVRQYVHPGRLIGTVTPEVLMCIDDETHRMPPRGLGIWPRSPELPLGPVVAETQILMGDGDGAANGHVAAAPLSSVMNSRGLISNMRALPRAVGGGAPRPHLFDEWLRRSQAGA